MIYSKDFSKETDELSDYILDYCNKNGQEEGFIYVDNAGDADRCADDILFIMKKSAHHQYIYNGSHSDFKLTGDDVVDEMQKSGYKFDDTRIPTNWINNKNSPLYHLADVVVESTVAPPKSKPTTSYDVYDNDRQGGVYEPYGYGGHDGYDEDDN